MIPAPTKVEITGDYKANLLDGWEAVKERADGGTRVCEDLGKFFKRLAKLEADFGKNLQSLVAKEGKRLLDLPHMDGSVYQAVEQTMLALRDVAAHHAQFSDNVNTHVAAAFEQFAKRANKEKSKYLAESVKVRKDFQHEKDVFRKAKEAFRKQCAALHDAEAQLGGVQRDGNAQQLAKLTGKIEQLRERKQRADDEYQQALRFANQKQALFYTTDMPRVLDNYEVLDAEHACCIRDSIQMFSSAYLFKPPTYQTACEQITRAVDNVDPAGDIRAFVDKHTTTVCVPDDVAYVNDRDIIQQGDVGDDFEVAAQAAQKKAQRIDRGERLSDAAVKVVDRRPSAPPTRAAPVAAAPVVAVAAATATPVPSNSSGGEWGEHVEVDAAALVQRSFGLSEAEWSYEDERKMQMLRAQEATLNRTLERTIKQKEMVETEISIEKNAKEKKRLQEKLRMYEAMITTMLEKKRLVRDCIEMVRLKTPTPLQPDTSESDALPTVGRCRCEYTYDAVEDNELSFTEGEVLEVKSMEDSDWWYCASQDRTRLGFCPSNFVQLLDEGE